jgi:hypothetical protein
MKMTTTAVVTSNALERRTTRRTTRRTRRTNVTRKAKERTSVTTRRPRQCGPRVEDVEEEEEVARASGKHASAAAAIL